MLGLEYFLTKLNATNSIHQTNQPSMSGLDSLRKGASSRASTNSSIIMIKLVKEGSASFTRWKE